MFLYNIKKIVIFFISFVVLAFFLSWFVHIHMQYDSEKNNERIAKRAIRIIEDKIFRHDIYGALKAYSVSGSFALAKDQLKENHHFLSALKDSFSASIVYLMDKSGNVVASTTIDDGYKTLEGNNYAFRPYFKDAVAGNISLYLAMGTTTNTRGIYYSAPIMDKNKRISGVIAIKISAKTLDEEFQKIRDPALVASDEEIVFSSNIDEWVLKKIQKYDYFYATGKNQDVSKDLEQEFVGVFFDWDKKQALYFGEKYSYIIHEGYSAYFNKNLKIIFLHPANGNQYIFYKILVVCFSFLLLLSAYFLCKLFSRVKEVSGRKGDLFLAGHEITESLIIIDNYFKIRCWNMAAREMFGYDAGEVYSRSIFEFLGSAENKSTLAMHIDAQKNGILMKDHQWNLVHKNGSLISCRWIIINRYNKKREISGFVLLGQQALTASIKEHRLQKLSIVSEMIERLAEIGHWEFYEDETFVCSRTMFELYSINVLDSNQIFHDTFMQKFLQKADLEKISKKMKDGFLFDEEVLIEFEVTLENGTVLLMRRKFKRVDSLETGKNHLVGFDQIIRESKFSEDYLYKHNDMTNTGPIDMPKMARILLVDDETLFRDIIAQSLKIEGYDVLEASDGTEALKILATENIDLVISDMRMPEMSGDELVMEMERLGYLERTKVIISTGSVSTGDHEESFRKISNKIVGSLSKPFAIEELVKLIKKQLL